MTISPDQIVLFRLGLLEINATLAFTWLVMALLVVGSYLVTRRLSDGPDIARGPYLRLAPGSLAKA